MERYKACRQFSDVIQFSDLEQHVGFRILVTSSNSFPVSGINVHGLVRAMTHNQESSSTRIHSPLSGNPDIAHSSLKLMQSTKGPLHLALSLALEKVKKKCVSQVSK